MSYDEGLMSGFYWLLSEAGGQCGLEELGSQEEWGKLRQRKG